MSLIKGIKGFMEDMNFLIVRLFLIITYLFAVGLTFILSRLVRKHFLETKNKEDYWTDLNLKEKNLEEFYRQF